MQYQFHQHKSENAFIGAVVEHIVAGLAHQMALSGNAHLALSGGTTPGAVYQALARQSLDWPCVAISLVDERWVEDATLRAIASNAEMLKQTMLTGNVNQQTFNPLADYSVTLADSVKAANQRHQPISVIVLGMGDDGHTASLFPGAKNLSHALNSEDAYVAIDATGCEVAGRWTTRISMTPHGWRDANQRLLLIRGEKKRDVFEHAVKSGDRLKYPILSALAFGVNPLQVHWAA